jgi:exopolyphosphatase/guanosine-5'-triphosphate,3'-diphosphate pyrophosphatase
VTETRTTPAAARSDDGDHVVGFIDIGTNSVRLMLVEIRPNQSFSVISLQRESVRLGEREFGSGRLVPEAIERAILVCRGFAELARSHGATELVTVATSATREAANRGELLERLEKEAGLDVHVISGREEARLIYLGLLGRADVGDRTALVVDIGGGSTELAVGDRRRHFYLESVRLGALRVTEEEVPGRGAEPVSGRQYQELQRHVRLASAHAVHELRRFRIDVAYGTSGTMRNLAAIAARLLHGETPGRDQPLTRGDLKKIAKTLRSMTADERRSVPGINPERADIIVAGAAILETLLAELDLPEIVALEDCGLREGMLMDYLRRGRHRGLVRGLNVRERSVVQLARRCKFDEPHARHVKELALALFDSGRETGLHDLGERERELLGYAALLHDIGTFLSYRDHHLHTAYLVRNADLLGFDEEDVGLVAAVTQFHRKALPGPRNHALSELSPEDRRSARLLSLLLRLAERLDRSHGGCVRSARFSQVDERRVVLALETEGDCHLELWGIQTRRESVEKMLGRTLEVETRSASSSAKVAGR